MKYIKYLSLVVLMSMFTTSCEDALNINENPLAATSADPNVILPFVFAQYSNRHVTELGTRIMDVPQHFSSCFNSARTGNTSIFLTGNTWSMMYTQVLGNLLLVEQDALEAGESSNNVAAIAKVVKANTYFELTSIWEEVPFTQALNAVEFPEPIFDSQEVVLNGVLDILDEAIVLIDAVPTTGIKDVSVGDLIYDGDMDLWRRYANSLKLRVLMMMRNKVNVDAEIATVLSQPLIEENNQSALVRYSNAPGGQNGFNNLVEAFFGVSNELQGIHCPARPIFDLLVGDPRFDMIINDDGGAGPPPMGIQSRRGDNARIKDNVIRSDLPHMLMMPAEINLYKAELALAAGNTALADTEFRAGVAKNVAWWGGDIPGARESIPAETADAFVASLPEVTMQAIHEQLYIESFIRPMVAWNTVRRTDVPTMDPVPGTIISTYLKRFNYAPNEVASNPNTPANLPTDAKMWFEN